MHKNQSYLPTLGLYKYCHILHLIWSIVHERQVIVLSSKSLFHTTFPRYVGTYSKYSNTPNTNNNLETIKSTKQESRQKYAG